MIIIKYYEAAIHINGHIITKKTRDVERGHNQQTNISYIVPYNIISGSDMSCVKAVPTFQCIL
jgi:hypothetical protein